MVIVQEELIKNIYKNDVILQFTPLPIGISVIKYFKIQYIIVLTLHKSEKQSKNTNKNPIL
jgi:hypothetical protein